MFISTRSDGSARGAQRQRSRLSAICCHPRVGGNVERLDRGRADDAVGVQAIASLGPLDGRLQRLVIDLRAGGGPAM